MMYDIDILLSIRFRTPTSKREVGVLKISTSAFLDSKYHLHGPLSPRKYKKKKPTTRGWKVQAKGKNTFSKIYGNIYVWLEFSGNVILT